MISSIHSIPNVIENRVLGGDPIGSYPLRSLVQNGDVDSIRQFHTHPHISLSDFGESLIEAASSFDTTILRILIENPRVDNLDAKTISRALVQAASEDVFDHLLNLKEANNLCAGLLLYPFERATYFEWVKSLKKIIHVLAEKKTWFRNINLFSCLQQLAASGKCRSLKVMLNSELRIFINMETIHRLYIAAVNSEENKAFSPTLQLLTHEWLSRNR